VDHGRSGVKALGLAVSDWLLAFADYVIE